MFLTFRTVVFYKYSSSLVQVLFHLSKPAHADNRLRVCMNVWDKQMLYLGLWCNILHSSLLEEMSIKAKKKIKKKFRREVKKKRREWIWFWANVTGPDTWECSWLSLIGVALAVHLRPMMGAINQREKTSVSLWWFWNNHALTPEQTAFLNRQFVLAGVEWVEHIIGSAEALPILCVRYFRWEREREIQRERERERRKWRHHCRAKIGDEFCTSPCQKCAP